VWYALSERIPESDATGGAIPDDASLSMETYSRFARKYLSRGYHKLASEVVSALAGRPRPRLLEIGPGPGWIGIEVARRLPRAEVVGLELSPDMIRVADANRRAAGIENLRFVEGDAARMEGFAAGEVDAVFSNGSLHHWLDPLSVFNQVARVLRRDGRVFICDGRRDIGLRGALIYTLLSSIIALDRTVPGRRMCRYWRSSIQAGYTPAELRAILSRSNLRGWKLASSWMEVLVRV